MSKENYIDTSSRLLTPNTKASQPIKINHWTIGSCPCNTSKGKTRVHTIPMQESMYNFRAFNHKLVSRSSLLIESISILDIA